MKWTTAFFALFNLLALLASSHSAQPAEDPHAVAFAQTVRPFLAKYCVRCHGPEEQNSNLRLDKLSASITGNQDAAIWTDLVSQLVLEKMPPEGEPQPPQAARREVVDWVQAELRRAMLALQSTGGRVVLRRLNQREYIRTVADLLYLPQQVVADAAENFSPDEVALGFDNVGAVQNLTFVQLNKYHEAATVLLNKAIVAGPPPESLHYEMVPAEVEIRQDRKYLAKVTAAGKQKEIDRMKAKIAKLEEQLRRQGPHPFLIRPRFDKLPRLVRADRIENTFGAEYVEPVLVDEQGKRIKGYNDFHIGSALSFPGSVPIPADGYYRITAQLGRAGDAAFPQTFVMSMDVGREDPNSGEFVRTNDWHAVANWQVVTPVADIAKSHYETLAYLSRGKHGVWCTEDISFQREVFRSGKLNGQVFLRSFAIEGPVYDQWPPQSYASLFPNGPGTPGDNDYSTEILTRFIRRAYRRPPADEEVDRLLKMVKQRWEAGGTFEDGIRSALQYVLSSPSFLYLAEQVPPDGGGQAYVIDDYALAARLSYFLWGTMPDERLFELAARNTLHEPKTLHAEVERMLGDPRSQEFVHSFLGQWLKLDQLALREPALEKFPDFDEHLRRSMLQETEAFFTEMLEQNLNLDNFVASDFVMVNERLAVHYGIPGVKGDPIRRVPLDPKLHRGGLLGQASVLMATSTDVRTSPVARGAFVLQALLGKSIPFPPPNIPDLAEVPEEIDGRPITIAERLALHRKTASCAQCHDRIDPLGLALENFDAVGKWREFAEVAEFGGGRRTGSPIQPQGLLGSDLPFEDPNQFRAVLMKAEGDRLPQSVVRHLLVYALGRGLEFTDQPDVDAIVHALKAQGGGLRDLLHLITQSDLFRRK